MGRQEKPAAELSPEKPADPPAETAGRLQGLLDRHREVTTVPEEVRRGRAVEALERAGAAEALRALAKEAADDAVKKQAEAALGRMARGADAP